LPRCHELHLAVVTDDLDQGDSSYTISASIDADEDLARCEPSTAAAEPDHAFSVASECVYEFRPRPRDSSKVVQAHPPRSSPAGG